MKLKFEFEINFRDKDEWMCALTPALYFGNKYKPFSQSYFTIGIVWIIFDVNVQFYKKKRKNENSSNIYQQV